MKSSTNLTVQISLSAIIIFLLGINIVPAWDVYRSSLLITTDNPAGSSLAERYLILGDWPASTVSNAIENNQKYKLFTVTNSAKKG